MLTSICLIPFPLLNTVKKLSYLLTQRSLFFAVYAREKKLNLLLYRHITYNNSSGSV